MTQKEINQAIFEKIYRIAKETWNEYVERTLKNKPDAEPRVYTLKDVSENALSDVCKKRKSPEIFINETWRYDDIEINVESFHCEFPRYKIYEFLAQFAKVAGVGVEMFNDHELFDLDAPAVPQKKAKKAEQKPKPKQAQVIPMPQRVQVQTPKVAAQTIPAKVQAQSAQTHRVRPAAYYTL